MNKRVALIAAGCLALAAGCGTTVQGIGNTGPGGSSDLSIGGATPGAGPNGATPGGGLGGAGGGNTAAGYTGTGGAGGIGGTGSSNLAGGVGSGVSGVVGITKDKVYVGIRYAVNTKAANAALGASNITTGNEKADANAVVQDINASGGIAGRTLVPVWYADDATSQDTYTDKDNQACGAMTQDNHVFAAAGAGYTDNYLACIERSGASLVSSGILYGPDASTIAAYPDYYELSTAVRQRLLSDEVTSLVRQHYFSGWNTALGKPGPGKSKVGVISWDDSDYRPGLNHTLLPALAQAGHPVAAADVQRIFAPNSTAQDSIAEQQIQTAVLHFRQDGVTHVIADDTTGGMVLLFLEAAKSQHWYPRLGMNSSSGVEAFFEGHELGQDELNGALGLGWDPSIDLSASMSAHYETSATGHCFQVMKQRTGQTYDSTNAASIALSYCDELYLIRDAIEAIHGPITRTAFRQAIEALGTRFITATTPGTLLGPGVHHGAVNTAYDMQWDPNCPCVRYVSSHRLPG